ncbi:MAG: hypothetical protein AABW47_01375, partial [Nanoarchaeota archaeon]
MKKYNVLILSVFVLFFSLNFISAVAVENNLHLNIQVINSSGDVNTGTFNFTFNISTTNDCLNIVYTNFTNLTTDSRGIISYYLENTNLNYSDQYWLCYYRNNVLINASKLARNPYTFYANNSAHWIGLSNFNATQMENSDNLLNIKESWLSSFINSIVNLAFIQNLINSTGIYTYNYNQTIPANVYTDERIIALNTTANIGVLYNATASMIANLSINQYNWTFSQIANLSINQLNWTYSLIANTSFNQKANISIQQYVDMINNTRTAQQLLNGTNMRFGNVDFNNGWESGGVSISNGNIYAQTGYFYNITGISINQLQVNSSIMPTYGWDNRFDIGNSSLRWRNIYAGGDIIVNGTLYYGNEGILITALNDTGYVNGRITALNTTANIGVLYNATASMIANLSINQYNWTYSLIANTSFNQKANTTIQQYVDMINNTRTIGQLYNATASMIANLSINQYNWTYSLIANTSFDQKVLIYNDTLFNNAPWNQSGTNVILNKIGSNVGIGTTSPGAKLEVVGNVNISGATNAVNLNVQDTAGNGFYNTVGNTLNFNYGNNADVAGWINFRGYANGATQFRDLIIANGKGTEIAIFDGSTGNVGIGTTSPNNPLTVFGNVLSNGTSTTFGGFQTQADNSAYAHYITLGSQRTDTYFGQLAANKSILYSAGADSQGLLIGTYTDKSLIFGTNNLERMRINQTTGNVGIGTTAPDAMLTLGVNAGSHGYIRFEGPTIAEGNIYHDATYGLHMDTYGNSLPIRIDGSSLVLGMNGNVGIGTGDPVGKLEIVKDTTVITDENTYGLRIVDGASDVGLLLGTSSTNDASVIQSLDPATGWSSRPLSLMPNGGNVGIGTTSPTHTLNVYGNVNISGNLTLDSGANITLGNSIFMNRTNVGIGTTSPQAMLQITGTIPELRFNDTDRPNVNFHMGVANTLGGFHITETGIATDFFIQNTTGNVGIGTTGPGAKLEIKGDDLNVQAITDDTSAPNAKFQMKLNGLANTPLAAMQLYAPTGAGSEYLRFNIADSDGVTHVDAMVINRLGNVGIGTTEPGADLEIVGKVGTAVTALKVTSDGNADDKVFHFIGNAAFPAYQMVMMQTGNVGIGTTTPSQTLDVRGQGNFSGTVWINNNTNLLSYWNKNSKTSNVVSYNKGNVSIAGYNKVNQSDGFSASFAGATPAPYGITQDLRDNSFWIADDTDNFIYHVSSLGVNQSDG